MNTRNYRKIDRKGQEEFGYVIALILFLVITIIGFMLLFFARSIKEQFIRAEIKEDMAYNDLVIFVNSLMRHNVDVNIKGKIVKLPFSELISLNKDKKYNDVIKEKVKTFFERYIEVGKKDISVIRIKLSIPSQEIEVEAGLDKKCTIDKFEVKLDIPEDTKVVVEGCLSDSVYVKELMDEMCKENEKFCENK